jgi:hypothetical protein
MTSYNPQVVQAMRELNLAPSSVANAIVCPSGEVVLVLNSSRVVTWSPPPAGVNWPVRPSSAGPLGDGGRVGPPQCDEERLLESRRWRVKVLEAGVGPWPFPSPMAEEVARTLPGTPVCMREDFAHEPMAAVKERRAADPTTIVGTVEWAEFHDPHLGAEIRITRPRVHEALLLHHTLSAKPLAVSVVADVTTEPAVLERTNAWGHRVSEGMAECVARVGKIYSLDLVSHARAGGRLLMPVAGPLVEVRECRIREACFPSVIDVWPTGPVQEAGGETWRVRVVRFGVSKNGWRWTEPAGRALASQLSYAPVGVFQFENGALAHAPEEAAMTVKGPVVRHVVAHLTDPEVRTDGVYATLRIHEDARWLRTKLARRGR